jgi:hypothetical protein
VAVSFTEKFDIALQMLCSAYSNVHKRLLKYLNYVYNFNPQSGQACISACANEVAAKSEIKLVTFRLL